MRKRKLQGFRVVVNVPILIDGETSTEEQKWLVIAEDKLKAEEVLLRDIQEQDINLVKAIQKGYNIRPLKPEEYKQIIVTKSENDELVTIWEYLESASLQHLMISYIKES